jgi:hypothetical protein
MSRCKLCNVQVTDETLKQVYYDEDYPDIDIGPYCSDCIGKIRICSGCHHPHELDATIKYFGNGNFYCTACAENIERCGVCESECTIYKTVDGVAYCEGCYKLKFSTCSCCSEAKLKESFIGDSLTRAQYKGLFKKYKDLCEECYLKERSRFKKYDVLKCNRCGNQYTAGATGSNENYCKQCLEYLAPCRGCGKKHHNSRSHRTDEGDQIICTTCITRYKRCSVCNYYTKQSSKKGGKFGVKILCTNCTDGAGVSECPSCLSFKPLSVATGLCDRCTRYYSDGAKCGLCGRWKDQDGNCRSCGSTNIYNYTFKPQPHFWYTKKDEFNKETIFMGIENECTFSSREAEREALLGLYTAYNPNTLLAKSDASISGYGYEVVTQPMTLSVLHAMDLSHMFSHPQIKFSTSCGMHIHVGRNAFISDLHIYKVCDFVHNNTSFIDLVAGRGTNGYNESFDSKASKAVKDAKGGMARRGKRVNLSNPVTIEFRMFAGCVREFAYRYRLEFIHALITWASQTPVKYVGVQQYRDFVAKNIDSYPNIARFLAKNN